MIINRFWYPPPAPDYTISTFAPSLVAKAGSDTATNNYLSTVAAYNNGSFNGGGADNTAFNSAYTTYVSTLPGGGFGRDGASDTTGYLVWYPNFLYSGTWHGDYHGWTVVNNGSNSYTVNATTSSWPATWKVYSTSDLTAPVYGSYTNFSSLSCSGSAGATFEPYSAIDYSFKGFTAGSVFIANTAACFLFSVPSGGSATCYFRMAYKVFPADSSVLTTSYPITSRISSIIDNIAYTTDNGETYNYLLNSPLFDETTLTFCNPLVGTTATVTNWHYEYATRTYSLTYTDANNNTVTPSIKYGDSNITVTVGSNTYTYYYVA